MAKLYRSALGRAIDMDQLRLANEQVIAVGNMKVNARGDELGPGGQVVRNRNAVMNDYYNLNTPVVNHVESQPNEARVFADIAAQQAAKPAEYRGSLADGVVRNRQKRNLEDPEGNQ